MQACSGCEARLRPARLSLSRRPGPVRRSQTWRRAEAEAGGCQVRLGQIDVDEVPLRGLAVAGAAEGVGPGRLGGHVVDVSVSASVASRASTLARTAGVRRSRAMSAIAGCPS